MLKYAPGEHGGKLVQGTCIVMVQLLISCLSQLPSSNSFSWWFAAVSRFDRALQALGCSFELCHSFIVFYHICECGVFLLPKAHHRLAEAWLS